MHKADRLFQLVNLICQDSTMASKQFDLIFPHVSCVHVFSSMVGPLRFEPRTYGLKGRCSTVELWTQKNGRGDGT